MTLPLTISLHLSKSVLRRILAVVLLLGGLAAALDLAENASDLLAREDGDLLRYLGLRAPLILSSVAPVALIVGPVLTFLTLSGRNEFTIFRASGATTYMMLASLAPLAVLLGAGLFAGPGLFNGRMRLPTPAPYWKLTRCQAWLIRLAPASSGASLSSCTCALQRATWTHCKMPPSAIHEGAPPFVRW